MRPWREERLGLHYLGDPLSLAHSLTHSHTSHSLLTSHITLYTDTHFSLLTPSLPHSLMSDSRVPRTRLYSPLKRPKPRPAPLPHSLTRPSTPHTTPLHTAATTGDLPTLTRICHSHTHSLTQTNKQGETALLSAAAAGQCHSLTRLLELGADIHHVDHRGYTAMHIAACNGHSDIIYTLYCLTPSLTHSRSKSGATPLYLASERGHVHCIHTIMQLTITTHTLTHTHTHTHTHSDSKPHSTSPPPPLPHSHTHTTLNTRNTRGMTPLFAAAHAGHLDAVTTLLHYYSANVHIPDCHGATPVYVACCRGHTAILHTLITHGASVHTPNEQGVTPVHIASHEGHTAVLHLLFRKGASSDFYSKDHSGRTALQLARERGYSEVVELLRQIHARARVSGNMNFQLW
jgi:ankyrin repeat protein